jgi:hypothetical protein
MLNATSFFVFILLLCLSSPFTPVDMAGIANFCTPQDVAAFSIFLWTWGAVECALRNVSDTTCSAVSSYGSTSHTHML